jgi:hypothetical protein
MTTKWGTCNTKTGKIWINQQLAKKPVECLEYVILHELAHLKYRAITWRSLFRLCKGVPRKGIVFKEKAFSSTSLVRSSVFDFSKEHNCPCILKLLLPKGLFGAFVSNYTEYDCLDENEFLIVPNSRFEIMAIHPLSRAQRIVCRASLL